MCHDLFKKKPLVYSALLLAIFLLCTSVYLLLLVSCLISCTLSYTHTHINQFSVIVSPRFCGFTCISQRPSSPRCRKDMTAATCQLRQVLWIFLAQPRLGLTRKGKSCHTGKSAKKRSAQIFTCGWERRKLFHCIQSWSQDEFIDFGMLYPQCR